LSDFWVTGVKVHKSVILIAAGRRAGAYWQGRTTHHRADLSRHRTDCAGLLTRLSAGGVARRTKSLVGLLLCVSVWVDENSVDCRGTAGTKRHTFVFQVATPS